MCREKFCHLHVHSGFSLLDGYGSVSDIVAEAKRLGQPAIAFTEHGNISSVIEAKQSCEKYEMIFIPGSEFYIVPWGRTYDWRPDKGGRRGTARHLTVIAYNQVGYSNLLALTKIANKYKPGDSNNHFYYVPRITYNALERHNDGLIVTSGCMASDICSALNPETGVTASDYRLVNEVIDFMFDVFGLDRYFLELQDHDIDALREINIELFRINKRYGFDYLVTNDSHYAKKEDSVGQTELMCISSVKQGSTMLNPSPFLQGFIDKPVYYIASEQEMREKNYGFDLPDSAFTNTVKIAEMVEDIKIGYEPDVKKYRFPVMPEYEDDYDYNLVNIAEKGFINKYGHFHSRWEKARERLMYELNIINDLGFASYFLSVYDIKQFCDKEGIPMTVRGSAGGSIVLYCLGISDFCPLQYGLIFERFLNPERIDAPDIDMDFSEDGKNKVGKYIIDKYGKDYAAQVVTFIKVKARGAIKDAARIYEFPIDAGAAMSAKVPENYKAKISNLRSEESVDYVPNFVETQIEEDIYQAALRLQGQNKSVGMHPGAIMVSDRPLSEDYPMVRPTNYKKAISEQIVGFDYNSAESVGGIKLDLLVVDGIGVLHDVIKMVNVRYGKSYTFENIPVDDQASYDLICSGRLCEIFQLAGFVGRRSTGKIQPRCVEDVMVAASICRPGPNIYEDLYADRMHGRVEVQYKHQDLELVLKDVYGIALFQEDVMRMSKVIGGFSDREADTLRKVISKKIYPDSPSHLVKKFKDSKEKFIQRSVKRGYDKELVLELWDDMAEFAGYGFNRPHACAYARIAVKQAYMKCHYPIEFYAASLTGRRSDRGAKREIKNDKGIIVEGEYEEGKLSDLLFEMNDVDIKLLPPRLGKSDSEKFVVDYEEGGIRYPYGSVKNVGKAGKYLKGIDLNNVDNVTSEQLALFKKAGKRPLESLAVVGALDYLFPTRNHAVRAVEYLSKGLPPIRQAAFLPDEDAYTEAEFYALERELTGLYLTGHPLDKYNLKNQIPFDKQEVYETMHDEVGLFIGVVNKIRLHRDRKNNIMAFVDIEDDQYNTMSVVIFASVYDEVQDDICLGCVCKVLGKINVRYGKNEEEEAKLKKYGRVSILAGTIIGE